MRPSNPYAATKAAAEQLVIAYYLTFNVPIIITRSNNIYGPAQYPEKIIPRFILSLTQNRPLTVHGDGHHSRKYLYVEDLVDALLLLYEKGSIGEAYNIGTDTEFTNLEIAQLIQSKFNCGSIEFVSDRISNDERYSIDSSKIKKLGWTAKVSFADGLERTIQWYLKNGNNWWNPKSIELALNDRIYCSN